MAKSRKFTTYFNADTKSYTAGVQSMVDDLKKLGDELYKNQDAQRSTKKELDLWQKEAAKTQKELDKLEKSLEKHTKQEEANKKAVENAEKALEKAKKQAENAKNQADKNTQSVEDAQKALEQARKALQNSQTAIKNTQAAIQEKNKALKENKEKTEESRNALDELKLSEAELRQKITDTNDKLAAQGKAMNDLSGNLSNVANNAKNVAGELKSIADAALKSTSGVFEFVHAAAEWADSTNTLRDQTGISVDQLQKFEFATQQIDVSIDTITTSIARLTRNMNSAKDGAGSAAEAFKTLGVDVVDSDGNLNNSIETFYKLIDALADVENETERDSLSMTLFGKNAMQLNPLIKGGADTLKKLGDEAERAGLILDQETLNSLHAFNDEIDTLKSKGNQIKRLIAVEAQPAVQDLVNVSDKLLDELKAMADSGELANIAKNTAGTITNLAEALKNLTLFLIRHKDIVAGAVAGYAAFKVSLSIAQLVYALANAFKSLKTATDAAAMAQAFFDKTLKISTVGAVATAVLTLAAAFGAFAISANTATDSTNNLVDSLASQAESAAQTQAQAQTQTKQLEILANQYDSLRKQVTLTAQEQIKLDETAQKIADSMGVSVDSLKDASGAYRDLSGDIQATTDSLQSLAKSQALSQQLTSAYQNQLSLEEQNAQIVQKLIDSGYYDQNHNIVWHGEITKDIDALLDKQKELSAAYGDAKKQVEYYEAKVVDSANTTAEAIDNDIHDADDATETYKRYREIQKEILELADKRLKLEKLVKEAESDAYGSGSSDPDIVKQNVAFYNELCNELKDVKNKETELRNIFDDMTNKAQSSQSVLNQGSLTLKELAESAESAESRLKKANKELLENISKRQEIKKQVDELKKQIEAAAYDETVSTVELNKLTSKYNELLDQLATVQTEETTIRKNIADIKKEIKSTADTADAEINSYLSSAADVLSVIDKIKKEVADGGSMTLSTVTGLMKKYPELTDKLNDYVNGLSDEKAIIESLEKSYQTDLDNYNSALALKKLSQGNYTADMVNANADLINKYKEQYGIDLQNFVSVEAAKIAAKERLEKQYQNAKSRYNAEMETLRNRYEVSIEFGQEVIYDKMTGKVASPLQTADYRKRVQEAEKLWLDALDQNYDFDEKKFTEELTKQLSALYSGVDADKVKNLSGGSSGSSGSSGNSSSSKSSEKWILDSKGVFASGSTKLAAGMNWLDSAYAMNKITLQNQIDSLKKWRNEWQLTREEQFSIDQKLYSLEKQLREQQDKEEKDSLQKRLDMAKIAYEKLVENKKSAYEQSSKAIQQSAKDEINAIDEELKAHKQKTEDDDRKKQIAEIDAQLKYSQLGEIGRLELERKKQDILNAQAETDYQREMEQKKIDIQQEADKRVADNTAALERLTSALESASLFFARQNGSLTNQQIINNSTKNQTINYLRQGVTEKEFEQLMKKVW